MRWLIAAGILLSRSGWAEDERLRVLSDLASADPEIQIAAVRDAGRAGDALFLDPIRSLLSPSHDVGVRAAAAMALGDLGVPRTSHDLTALSWSLDQAARDESATVAVAAIASLGRYPFPEVRRSLLELAGGAPSPRTDAAKRALAMPLGGEARARLDAYLEVARREAGDPTQGRPADPIVRFGAARGSKAWAGRALVAGEKTDELDAVSALGVDPIDGPSARLLLHALRSKDGRVKVAALGGLARHDTPETTDALGRALEDRDAEVRRAAADGLSSRTSPRSTQILAAHMEREGTALAASIGAILAKRPPGDVLPVFARWTRFPPSAVAAAIEVAATSSSAASAVVLTRFMLESAEAARAKDVLDRWPIDVAGGPLLRALASSAPDGEDRRRLIEAVRGRSEDVVTEALLELVERGQGDAITIGAVLERSEDAVRPRLLSMLGHDDQAVRSLALAAIEPYRGEDVVDALVGLMFLDPGNGAALDRLALEEASLAPMLRLLASQAHATHHGRILEHIAGVDDPAIAEPVTAAALANPILAAPAAGVLDRQTSPSAVPAIAALAAEETVDHRVRARAAASLGRFPMVDVKEPLQRLAKDPSLDVRRAARNALHGLEPQTYPSWDPYGRIPLIVEGSLFGGVMMIIAADLAGAELSPFFSGGVGLVLGGATPFLLTLKEDVTLGDAGYFGTVGLYGTLLGWGLGNTIGLSDQHTRWLTIGGEVLGVGLGGLTMKWAEWGLDDFFLANVSIVEAGLGTAAIRVLADRSSASRKERLSEGAFAGMIGSAVATVPIAFLSRRVGVEDDIGLLATTMLHGAWIGLWLPGFLPGGFDGERGAAGAVVGQSAGYLAGLIWAQLGDLRYQSALFSALGAGVGSAAFGGLGLVIRGEEAPETFALLAAGSAAGALTLGILEPYLTFGENDAAVIAIAAGAGALSGADLSVRIEEKRFAEASFPGGILLGAGIGTAAGLLVSQLTDVSDKELWSTLGGAAIFGLAGTGFGLMVPELDVRNRSRVSGAAIAAGVALTYPFADRLELSGPKLAYAGLSAASFGIWSSLLPEYWIDGEIAAGKHAGGAVLGASIGMALGLAVSQGLELTSGDVLVSGVGAVTGSGIGAGVGLLVPALDDRGTVALMQGGGLAGLAIMTGLASLDLVAGGSKDAGAIATHVALMSLQGAWHGTLIPFAWRDGRPPAREIAGGAMLGTSLGAIAGFTAAHLLDEPLRAIDLVEASALAGIANGIGAGLAIGLDDPRIGVGLMEGIGIGGYAAALALAPRTDYEGGAFTLLAAPPVLGFFGWFFPQLFEDEAPDVRRSAGGLLTAASAGALAGVAFTQLREDRDELELILATAAGTGIGAGLGGLIRDRSSRRTVALMESGGLLALSAAVAIAPHTRYGDGGAAAGDAAAAGLGTISGAAFGALLPGLIYDDAGDLRELGYGAALGAGFGLAASMGIGQLTDPDPSNVLETALLTIGAGAAGGGLALYGEGFSARSRSIAIESAVLGGLALGAIVAPFTSYRGEDATMIALTTGAGAWHGLLLASIVEERPSMRERAGAALLGAGAMSLTGVSVGQLRPLAYGDQLETGIAAAAGNAIGGGLSMLLDDMSERDRAIWIEAAGLSALALGIGVSPYTEYSGADVGLVAAFSAIGAWNGLWLDAYVEDDGFDGRELGGGALAGAGAGWLTGALVSQFVEIGAGDQAQAYLSWAVGSAIGAGLGLLVPSFDRRQTVALMEGIGGAGLVAGLSVLPYLDYEGGDFALVPLGAFLGGAVGLTLPRFVRDGAVRSEEAAGGALLGAGAGTLVAAGIAQGVDLDFGDVAEAGAFSVAGAALGLGLGLAIPASDRRLQLGLMDGATAAGLGLGVVLAPFTDYQPKSALNLGLGAAIGGLVGAFTPALYNGPNLEDAPPEQIGGAGMLGAAVGLGAGVLIDQTLELDGDARENVAIGAAMGGLSGAGIGLLASEDDRVFVGLMNGLTLAGAIGVGATSKMFRYGWGDVALGSAYVAYLTWHTSGLTLLLEGTDRQAIGAAMSTVGLGALTGMYLAPYINLDLADILMLMAGNVWGTWIGGWGGEIFRNRIDRSIEGRRAHGLRLLSSVLGSDVGLAVTGFVVGGLLDVPPIQFAIINLSGLGGMMIGMLSAGFARGKPLQEGNVIGALSGLILGAVVTSFFDWNQATTWDDLLSKRDDEPVAPRPELAIGPPKARSPFALEAWFPSATVQPGPTGEEQYLFVVSGVFR
jgi:HEAT repeat protein